MKKSKSIFIFLALFIPSLFACKTDEPPADVRDRPRLECLQFPGIPELIQELEKIPEGTNIIVDETLAPLIPKHLKLNRYFSLHKSSIGFICPDKRTNPAKINYLFGIDSALLSAVRFGRPDLWSPKISVDVKGVKYLFLKRTRPVGKQLAPLLTNPAFQEQMDRMEKVEYFMEAKKEEEQKKTHFFLDRYEVTNAQYAHYLNDVGILYDEANVYYSIKDPTSKIVFHDDRYHVYNGLEKYPVFNVSFYGARAFCEYYGKRLATYDEWRHASGYWIDRREFPWGQERDFSKRANFAGSQDGYLLWSPVDAFPEGKSPYGIFNMAGNMFEWLGSDAHLALGGGSFEHPPEPYALTSKPSVNVPLARNLHDGFRCAKD